MDDLDQAFILAVEAEMAYCKDNIEYFIDTYGYVEDLDSISGISRFRLWPGQKQALREIMENRRNILLKARQLGITWLVLWIALHMLLFRKGCTVVALSKKDADAMELVRRMQFMCRHLPPWMVLPKADVKDVQAAEMTWEKKAHEVTIFRNDGEPSRFITMPATEDTGRSFTAAMVILDEWAYQYYAREIWQSAYPTINRPTGGKVIGLSTAKRMTLFHDIWQNADKYKFHRIFLPWDTDPRRTPEWYADTVSTMRKTEALQEYPSTPEEAFSAGEDTAFPEFSVGIHVCEPFTIPEHWTRWMAVDNGYNDPFAWLWFAVSEDGQVYLYREYSRDYDDEKVYYTDQAAAVMELNRHITVNSGQSSVQYEKVAYIVAGMDAWSTHHRDQSGKSLIDYYMDGGIKYGFIKPETDRRLRKATLHEYLKPYDDGMGGKTAKLQIFSSCKHTINTLPDLLVDEKDHEKVADCDIDHCYDALGYGLISYHKRQSKPVQQQKTALEQYKDRKAKKLQRQRRLL